MLCDAHIHFIPREIACRTNFYKGVWTDERALSYFLTKNEISSALLVYPSTEAYLKFESYRRLCEVYNTAIEKLARQDNRIIPAGLIDLSYSKQIKDDLKKLHARGFRAISVASSFDGRFLSVAMKHFLAIAGEFNFLICVHPQTINPIGFERVKDSLLMPVLEYSLDLSMFLGLLMMEGVLDGSGVKFLFSSLAGVLPFLKDRFDRVYSMLRARGMVKDLGQLPSDILKNVYVDTAGSGLANIRLARELFGADKILWGSDYPVNADITDNLKEIGAFEGGIIENIRYKNFLTLTAVA